MLPSTKVRRARQLQEIGDDQLRPEAEHTAGVSLQSVYHVQCPLSLHGRYGASGGDGGEGGAEGGGEGEADGGGEGDAEGGGEGEADGGGEGDAEGGGEGEADGGGEGDAEGGGEGDVEGGEAGIIPRNCFTAAISCRRAATSPIKSATVVDVPAMRTSEASKVPEQLSFSSVGL